MVLVSHHPPHIGSIPEKGIQERINRGNAGVRMRIKDDGTNEQPSLNDGTNITPSSAADMFCQFLG
jgi:hypothetical protein